MISEIVNDNLTWPSSNKKMATVSSKGLVKAKKACNVKIKVRTEKYISVILL
ncbi:hypothetical protein lbkm_0283 [Lachnospiraceae bacterium KM106-2]|nr:hypothetical protein lbkm_0283 [Lachnospiraceae bacterium KM106-2]